MTAEGGGPRTGRVEIADIEAKLRELTRGLPFAGGGVPGPEAGGADGIARVPGGGRAVLLAAAVVAVLLPTVAYVLGRRRGRRAAPVLEIRRI